MNVEYLEILYDATRARIGLVVETDNAERLRQRLYAARKDSPDLTNLSFIISPMNGSDLWIINKGTSDDAE
jgi:hypothetical protein